MVMTKHGPSGLSERPYPRCSARQRMGKRTTEQRGAFAELRAIAEPHCLRVRADTEGFPAIPGRYGQIEWTGGQEFAVYCDRPRLFRRLWAIPGVRRHQTGDREMRALFLPKVIEPVAAVIKARRRRIGRPLSPEAARSLRGARAGTTSAVQEPISPGETGTDMGAPSQSSGSRLHRQVPGPRA